MKINGIPSKSGLDRILTCEEVSTVQKGQNRTETGQKVSGQLSKTNVSHWTSKLRKRSYLANGERIEIPNWQVRLFHSAREDWFNLGTPNKAAAAAKAREIYLFLQHSGWDATLAKYKPKVAPKSTLTIDDFEEVYRSAIKRVEYPPAPMTAERYLKDFKILCRAVNVRKIAELTPEKVREFTGKYREQAHGQSRDVESAKISCNAILRNAGALFSKQMVAEYSSLGLTVANPFLGQKLRRVKIRAYAPLNRELLKTICVNAAKLRDGDPDAQPPTKTEAQAGDSRTRWTDPDFRKPHPEAYTLFLLEFGLGLRRNEADKAQRDWLAVDTASGQAFLTVKQTPFFTPKSREARVIPISQALFSALDEMISLHNSEFIVDGREPKNDYAEGKAPKNIVYRCDTHHRTLSLWLRKQGVADAKPCHLLRKEFGSYVATKFSLFHAQKVLGHSSPKVTSDYYASLTDMPALDPTLGLLST